MKKLLVVPLLLGLLYGCSNDELKEEVALQLNEAKSFVEKNELQSALEILGKLENTLNEANEEKLLTEVQNEIKHVKTLIAEEQEHSNQLAKLLIGISDHYGYVSENHQFHDSLGDLAFGIVHAQLLDFNNDGRDELYVLFRSSNYANDELSHRNQRGYIEEIWGVQENEPILLKHDMYNYEDTSYASDLTLSFVNLKDGTVAIKQNHEKTGQGIHNSVNTYFTLSENSFVEKEFFHSSGSTFENIPAEFYIDEQLVDEQAYEMEKQKFEGEERFIFKSSAGTKEFAIDLSNTKESMMEIVDTLTANNNEALLESESIKITTELTNTFNKYKNFGNMDVRDSSYYPSMLLSLIQHGFLENDTPGEGYYSTAFSKKAIQTAMKKYYNLEVDPATFGLSSDFSSMDLLVYQNNTLYLVDTGLYSMMESVYTPEKVVQIADDLYYAKVNETLFDLWAYADTYWESDYNQFIKLPLTEWPENTHEFLEEQLPTYLLLKENGNEYQLLYKGKYNMTDKELAEF